MKKQRTRQKYFFYQRKELVYEPYTSSVSAYTQNIFTYFRGPIQVHNTRKNLPGTLTLCLLTSLADLSMFSLNLIGESVGWDDVCPLCFQPYKIYTDFLSVEGLGRPRVVV